MSNVWLPRLLRAGPVSTDVTLIKVQQKLTSPDCRQTRTLNVILLRTSEWKEDVDLLSNKLENPCLPDPQVHTVQCILKHGIVTVQVFIFSCQVQDFSSRHTKIHSRLDRPEKTEINGINCESTKTSLRCFNCLCACMVVYGICACNADDMCVYAHDTWCGFTYSSLPVRSPLAGPGCWLRCSWSSV